MHNDVRAEEKERSVQWPCKRLKFENILTVVPLLFLARMCSASSTDYSASKVAKIAVRHKNSVHKGWRICIPAVINSRKAKRKVFFCEWKHPRGLLAWLWSGWIDYVVVQHFTRSVTISFLCSLQWCPGTAWESFQILIFAVVVAYFFPFFLLLRHYALPVGCGCTISSRTAKFMQTRYWDVFAINIDHVGCKERY